MPRDCDLIFNAACKCRTWEQAHRFVVDGYVPCTTFSQAVVIKALQMLEKYYAEEAVR